MEKENKTRNIPQELRQIISRFNSLSDARQRLSLNIRLILLFTSITVVTVSYFAYRIQRDAMQRIIVVDSTGEMKKVRAESEDKVYLTLLYSHCEQSGTFANSFDEFSISENQEKASHLIAKADLDRIIAAYAREGAYQDVRTRGVTYRYQFGNILTATNLGGNEYRVQFYGILSILDGEVTKQVRITSEGIAIRVEPHWPQNVTGYRFRTYSQSYSEPTQEDISKTN